MKGYELEFRNVATIVPSKNMEVPVAIWEIDGRDEHTLDRYEGFPNFYRKELFEVEVNGESMEVMAYLMNNGKISPPSQSYYNTIKQGYADMGMDVEYLNEAVASSIEFQTRSDFNDDFEDYDDDESIYDDIDDGQLSF